MIRFAPALEEMKIFRKAASVVLHGIPPVRGKKRVAALVHRLFPPRADETICTTQMRLGYKMIVDLRSSNTEWGAYYTGDYDTDSIRAITKIIEPGWTILDIGANIGFWTIPLAQAAGPTGTVHAFEPMPTNFRRLGQNVQNNRLTSTVRLHELGLSDSPAKLSLSLREDFDHGSETGNAAIVIDESDQKYRCVEIRVEPLDSLLAEYSIQRLDFIKIDIEGHEDRFLRGAAKSIDTFRPCIYMEINEPYYKRRGMDITAVLDAWLSSIDYCSIFRRNGAWVQLPVRDRMDAMDDVLLAPRSRAEAFVNHST